MTTYDPDTHEPFSTDAEPVMMGGEPKADNAGSTGPRPPRTHLGRPSRRTQPFPADLGYSRRNKPAFGPLTTRVVDPATTDWPHRCVVCGRRTHAGIDCDRVRT